MGKSYSVLTLAAAGSAVAALGILLHWAIVQPEALPAGSVPGTLFLKPFIAALDDGTGVAQWFRAAFLWLAVGTGVLGAGLALLLVLKAEATSATRRLAAALGLGAWAGTYFIVVPMHQVYLDGLGWQLGAAWQYGLHAAGWLAALFAPYLLARFFFVYPQAPLEEQWREHFATVVREGRTAIVTGWRRHFYRPWRRPEWLMRFEGHMASGQALQLFMRENLSIAVIVVLALVAATADVLAFGQPAGHKDLLQNIPWMLAVVAVATVLGTAYEALRYHRRNALPLDRSRIDWIYGATLIGALACGAVVPIWSVLWPFLIPALESRGLVVPAAFLILGPLLLVAQAAVIAFIVSLALSVFYRGAVDPRLATRKVTLIGLLSLIVAGLFVLVERAVAVKLAAWLDLPRETGLVVAGAVVGISFLPLRARVERWVDAFVTHFLPLDSLVSGERKTQAVVMADLSGYTALSARDEKQAHLLAALLQKLARKACSARRGRLVKSMGDAVMLAFDRAEDAVAVLEQLHAEFEPAADTLGLERLRVHSGGHIGEVTQTADGDLYGQTVNITARLQGLAAAGDCVVSGALADAAAIAGGRRRELGAQRLKNVPEPVISVGLRLAGAPA